MPTFGSLFAGIGGIDLGLERAGWTGRWQVEWDPWCQHVLAHHWPDVPRYGDIRTVHGPAACPVADAASGDDPGREVHPRDFPAALPREAPGSPDTSGAGRGDVSRGCPQCLEPVDLIAGGFPCQPFSVAGKRRGTEDDRWLWPEFERAIRELGPRYVLVENVPGLLAGHGGMGLVLGGLAALGYDAEWDCIPASAVGAPHRRDRVWIVAHAGQRQLPEPDAGGALADAVSRGQQGPGQPLDAVDPAAPGDWQATEPVDGGGPDFWRVEPDVGRVAHGVPGRVDRLRALGNAVVPQVVEVIGRRILADYLR